MHVFRVELRREARIANQITEKHRDRPTVALRRVAVTPFRRRGAVVSKQAPAASAIPIATLVTVAAFPARHGQDGAAGRAELASLPVFELAAFAAQSL
jgi:hypothetical protein